MISIRDLKKRRDDIAILSSMTSSLQMISATKRVQYLKKMHNYTQMIDLMSGFYPDTSFLDSARTLYIFISSDQRFCKNFLNLLNKKISEIKIASRDNIMVFGKYSFKTTALIKPDFEQYRSISNFYECDAIASKVLADRYSNVRVCSYHQETSSFKLSSITSVDDISSESQKIDSIEFCRTYIALKIYGLFLESSVREESERSMAMSEASENAKTMTKSLDRQRNQIRQSQITKEITSV